MTNQHENRAILGLATPVLRGEAAVARPVGLLSECKHVRVLIERSDRTFIPHLKGETLVPTTGSWFMAKISLFVRISNVSLVMVDI